MKKYFSVLALAAMTATVSFTSCNEDDDAPEYVPVQTSEGVFVVCGGNKSGGIDGSLTYYDYATAKASQGVYQAANHVSLGITIPDAVVYGNKIYIVGDGEKTIFVADKNTLTEITNIKVEVKGEAATPRKIVAGDGHVYVSTYSNAVIDIDTVTNTIVKEFASGDYSDGIALHNGYLYTADSDYGRYGKAEHGTPSITKINLATGQTETITDDAIKNPQDVMIVQNRLFYLDSGYYDADYNQEGQGLFEIKSNGEVVKLTSATDAAADDDKIYIVDAPYSRSGTTPSYKVVDIATSSVSTFCDGSDIAYPAKVSTDPLKGYVYITSYQLKENSSSADYKLPGYCVIYNTTGSYQTQFTCGVGGGKAVPNTSVK